VRYLQTYKLFESVNDDAYEKWVKVKSDYDKGVQEIKDEYLKGVSDCLYDLTDDYDFTSKVEIIDFSKSNDEYWKFMGNLVAKFEFKVPIDKINDFFETLFEIDELVKSHVSRYRRIIVKDFDIQITTLHKLEIYSLDDVYSKVMNLLMEPRTKRQFIANSEINFATIQIEI
jgi:hypothetical protein